MTENKANYNNNIIYKNSIMSLLYKIFGAALSFISAPLMLFCLGEIKYGVWVTVLSLISWIYYFDLGIGNGLRNKLAAAIALKDTITARKYLATAYVLIAKTTIVIFIIGIIVFYWFDFIKWTGISNEEGDIKICIAMAFFFACINFVMSLVNNVLYAVQKASCVNMFNVIGQTLFVVLLGLYAVCGVKTILLFAIGEGFCQLLKNIFETIFVFRNNPELLFNIKDYDKQYTTGILSFGIQMFIVQIAALVLNSTDNLVIINLFGAAEVTPYNFCFKFFSMIQSLYVVLITPLLSAYTAAYALKDYSWMVQSLKRNGWLFIIFSIGTIVAALIFKPFMKLWLQRELAFDDALIICTVLYFLLLMLAHIFSTFLTGIGRIKETTILTVFSTLLNIPISVYLARDIGMGISGVVMGSAVCLILGLAAGPILTIRELNNIRRAG